MSVDENILIEELIDKVPQSVSYLMEKGIKCLACGEPIWGTLEQAAREKGFSEKQIKEIVGDLNNLAIQGAKIEG